MEEARHLLPFLISPYAVCQTSFQSGGHQNYYISDRAMQLLPYLSFCFFPVFIVLFDYFCCGWLENQNGCWQMSGHSWKTTCRQKVRCGGTGEGRPHNCVVEISPGIVAILKFTISVFVVSDFHSFSLTRGKYRTFVLPSLVPSLLTSIY